MYLLIIFLPFFNYWLNLIFGIKYFGAGSLLLTIVNMTFLFFLVVFAYYEILFCNSVVIVDLGNWINFQTYPFNIKWEFLFDGLTLSMCFIITFISLLVHIYSISYMRWDVSLIRFLSYLSLFTFFMLMLVTGKNFIILFLGWEGVGVASYLLISFWNTRKEAVNNGLKAMLINKIGDICLLLSFGFIYYFFNTFDYYVIFEVLNICDANFFNSHFFYNETFYFCKFYLIDAILLPISEFSFIELNLQKIFLLVAYFIVFCLNSYLYWIALLLFLGAMGKSAQMGFHTWLPDAMEGPTPVSALIHAATMVTAGVFLVIRCSPFFVLTPNVTNFIIFIGSFTAIFAGTIALVQYDMKKIIAYSTCSQLGYMFFSCGLLNFDVALFHLVNHAFFKALLFLSSGVLIHAMFDEQDLRRFGGLFRIMPITYVMVLIGSIALTGIPFFTGYYSKDLIIELSVGSFTFFGNLAYCFGLMGCLLTACYSLRLVRYVFFLIPNKKKFLILAHEGDYTLLFPLFLLSFFSIFFGFLFKEIYIGIGSDIFVDVFYRSLNFFDSEFFFSNGFNYFLIKNLPLLFAFFGFFFNYYFLDLINALINYLLLIQLNNSLSLKILEFRYKLLTYFFFRWYIDNLYSDFAYKLFLYFINFFYFLDRGFIEKLPLFIIDKVKISKLFFNLIQSGYIYIYIYLILFFSLLFLNIVIFGIL